MKHKSHNVGQSNPKWKPIGSRRVHKAKLSYWKIKIAEPNEWAYEHRKVAQELLGRPLSETEHVHHIDGDGLNNEPRNIEVVTRMEHAHRHRPKTWAKSGASCCKMCGETDRPHFCHDMCNPCFQRYYRRLHLDKFLARGK